MILRILKLSNNISLKNVVTLITCIIKNDGKFYPQICSEKSLFAKRVRYPTRWWD